MNNWKFEVLRNIKNYNWQDGCLINSSLLVEDNIFNDIKYVERARNKYTTTSIETEIVYDKLAYILSKYNIKKDNLIMDVGCGDGRISNFLLNKEYKKIIAVDIDADNIRNLNNYINLKDKQCILPIVEDINELPIKKGVIDVVIAWGIISLTCDYLESINNVLNLIKPNGLLIIAEPTLESNLIYSLVRGDLEEFCNIANTSSRAAMWDDKENRYHVYSKRELEEFIKLSDVKLLENSGISIFPSLVFGGISQEKKVSENVKEKLLKTIFRLNDSDIKYDRQIIYVLKKNG